MPLPTRDYDRSLNAEIERLLYQADVVRQEAEGLVAGLTDAQFQWNPAPGAWSMAQCVDHLNIINAGFLKEFEAAIGRGRAQGILSDGPYTYGFLGRWVLRIVQPTAKRKFKAPKKLQPRPAAPMAELMETFHRGLERFKDQLHRSNGLDLQRLKVTSPVSSLFKYNLGIAYWIRTGHDRRHLHQAREVRNLPNFPKA